MSFPLDPLPEANIRRIPRWYFGGIAATLAQVFIHPIDVVKVGIQTEQIMEKISVPRYVKYLLRTQGLMRIYQGLGASMRQQFVHSITRFGIYLKTKEILHGGEMPLLLELGVTAFSGTCGAILKTPFEIVNVRMQTDYKLSPQRRYNYKNVRHAVTLITLTDGYRGLFIGVQLNIARSIVFTCSQICFYYKFKQYLRQEHDFADKTGTHVLASALAGIIATLLCQPIDVMKVRYMSDELSGVWDVIKKQIRLGPAGFYRGTVLTFFKIEIQTIITLVTIEKLRVYYGIIPHICADEREALIGRCRLLPKPPPKPAYLPSGILHGITNIAHYILNFFKMFRRIPNIINWFRRAKPPPVEEKVEEVIPEPSRKEEAVNRLVGRIIIFGYVVRKLFQLPLSESVQEPVPKEGEEVEEIEEATEEREVVKEEVAKEEVVNEEVVNEEVVNEEVVKESEDAEDKPTMPEDDDDEERVHEIIKRHYDYETMK